MNQKQSTRLVSVILTILLIGLVFFIIKRNQNKIDETEVNNLEKPFRDVIEIKKQVRGKVVPSQINHLKCQTSGVIEQLYITAGEQINSGQLIAKIKVTPSPDELKEAQRNVQISEVNYLLDKKLYEKNKSLLQSGGVSEAKVDEIKAQMEISQLKYNAELYRLNTLIKGENNEDYTELVYSDYAGMVLEVSVKIGNSVNKRSINNDGTTLAKVAKLDSLVFEGKINESDVNNLQHLSSIILSLDSYKETKFEASISEISPISINENGINKFKFKANFISNEASFNFTGISAKADILFERTDSVLCVKEKYLQYDNEQVFVEVQKNGNNFRKNITLGLSDGEKVEVKTGLKNYHLLLLPNWDEE